MREVAGRTGADGRQHNSGGSRAGPRGGRLCPGRAPELWDEGPGAVCLAEAAADGCLSVPVCFCGKEIGVRRGAVSVPVMSEWSQHDYNGFAYPYSGHRAHGSCPQSH